MKYKFFAIVLMVTGLLSLNGTSEQSQIESITIAGQTWSKRNLNVSAFANGDVIKECKTAKEWLAAAENQQPAWCYYNNDPANSNIYGKLYNYYAVVDKRGLAPKGWAIPKNEDWVELANNLGGENIGGLNLKHKDGVTHGFDGYYTGYRNSEAVFLAKGSYAEWWCYPTNNMESVGRAISTGDNIALTKIIGFKSRGVAIRLIKR
jgi:uncharacterized protein (TIGR02145 family)